MTPETAVDVPLLFPLISVHFKSAVQRKDGRVILCESEAAVRSGDGKAYRQARASFIEYAVACRDNEITVANPVPAEQNAGS